MKLFAVALSVLFVAYGQGTSSVDMENSYQNLQQAVKDNDAAKVQKLAAETSAAARAIMASPAPQGASEKETWNKDVALAKEINDYVEYGLYTVAIQAKPDEAVELFGLLEQVNPKSKYLDQGYGFYLGCLQNTGAGAKVPGIAAKALANFPGNEDLLLIAANSALSGRRYDQAIAYGDRLAAAASKHGKAALVTEGRYIAGVGHFFRNQYPQTNKELGAVLPSLSGEQKGCALLYLAISNFNLGKATMNKGMMQQGANYAAQSAGMKSQCQAQAYQNAVAMKAATK